MKVEQQHLVLKKGAAAMLIVDAQVHRKAGRSASANSFLQQDDLLAEMDEGGVDPAVLHPPSWDPRANEIVTEAAAAHQDRLSVLRFFDVTKRRPVRWKISCGSLAC